MFGSFDFNKNFILYRIVLCSLFFTHIIFSQDTLITLRNNRMVSKFLVEMVRDSLDEIGKDPCALYQLAGLSTNRHWKLVPKFGTIFETAGLIKPDGKFVNCSIQEIVALSIVLKPQAHLVNPLRSELQNLLPENDPVVEPVKRSLELPVRKCIMVTLRDGSTVPMGVYQQVMSCLGTCIYHRDIINRDVKADYEIRRRVMQKIEELSGSSDFKFEIKKVFSLAVDIEGPFVKIVDPTDRWDSIKNQNYADKDYYYWIKEVLVQICK